MEPAPRELLRFTSPPRACSYLPAETAVLEYRVHAHMGEAPYREMLRRGWRRHGAHFSRPRCPSCAQCRSLRVLVDEFQPSRSQRRIERKNRDVEVTLQPPCVTPEHVQLYNAYHAEMAARRGWSGSTTDLEDYENSFLIGLWPFAREMQYRRDGQLIGVGLVDVVDDALSSIYSYHAPDWRPRGPGTYSILQEIAVCQSTGRPYLYLGYSVAGCGSMAYKANFEPHELLEAYIDPPEEPRWGRSTGSRSDRGQEPDAADGP